MESTSCSLSLTPSYRPAPPLAFWSFSYTPRTEVRKRPSVTLSTLTCGRSSRWLVRRLVHLAQLLARNRNLKRLLADARRGLLGDLADGARNLTVRTALARLGLDILLVWKRSGGTVSRQRLFFAIRWVGALLEGLLTRHSVFSRMMTLSMKLVVVLGAAHADDGAGCWRTV